MNYEYPQHHMCPSTHHLHPFASCLCILLYNRKGSDLGHTGGSDSKASAYNAGDPGSIHGQEDLLEKEMATHSSTLAWKIPWMEEPGRLQSMGSQRAGHD